MSHSVPIGDAQPSRRGPRGRGAGARSKRPSPALVTLGVLVALVLLIIVLAQTVTAYLWFDQLGFRDVLVTRWITQAILFLIGASVFAIPLHLSLRHAFRARPRHPVLTREQEALEQFRTTVEPLRRGLTVVAPLAVGIFGGLGASHAWQEVLLFLHPQSFGSSDPLFGRDVSFYVFTLPMIDMALAFARFALLVTIVGALIGHVVFGGLAWHQEDGLAVSRGARRHLGVLAIAYLLVLGLSHWFERYDLLTTEHSRFHGAGYTDVHALLPAKTILAIAALIVAALFVAWILRGDWRIPVVGAGLMILSTLAVGSLYPYLIQTFKVEPNERALEQEYIAQNIRATRAAFGLEDVDVVDYPATIDAAAGALREDADTTAQIRLLDPAVVSPTFSQREANRRYWGFDDLLSVDRYEIDGSLQDTVLGVRELSPDSPELSSQSWVNEHIVYTHGYGMAAAYGNRRSPDGEPAFLESGVPGKGAFGDYEERVYFGRQSPHYSIVGAPKGAQPEEFDYQAGTGEGDKGALQQSTFTAEGGPSLGNWFVRFLYAVKFRDPNIVISDYVNSHSQILYERHPMQRVHDVAPYLSLDSGMYPAVVDGRMVWIIDAYTTTDRYPYAQGIGMDETVRDSQTDPARTQGTRTRQANYLRNSVKVTVDAYDGSVTLYAWDTDDPVLKAWNEIFPGQIRPTSEISGALMSHLRYPEDMFKAQRTLLARYHVTNASEFYGGQDFWDVSPDPTREAPTDADGKAGSRAPQPPYYLTMQMPGQDSPRFSLSSNFIPARGENKGVMTGYLAVDSETGNKAGRPADSYGKMTLLVLPTSSGVLGPTQAQAAMNSNPTVSEQLNLLKRGNSDVINGNLLTLPVGGGLLYVQPVYVQSSKAGSGAQYPVLQMVVVSFGKKIGFAPTLDEALDKVFGGDSGAHAGDAGVQAPGESGATGPDGGTGDAQAPGDAKARLDQALADMTAAQADADAALKNGDWAAYGEAQQRLAEALTQAEQAAAELDSGATAQPSDGGGG